jgi:hypothetical protein
LDAWQFLVSPFCKKRAIRHAPLSRRAATFGPFGGLLFSVSIFPEFDRNFKSSNSNFKLTLSLPKNEIDDRSLDRRMPLLCAFFFFPEERYDDDFDQKEVKHTTRASARRRVPSFTISIVQENAKNPSSK